MVYTVCIDGPRGSALLGVPSAQSDHTVDSLGIMTE